MEKGGLIWYPLTTVKAEILCLYVLWILSWYGILGAHLCFLWQSAHVGLLPCCLCSLWGETWECFPFCSFVRNGFYPSIEKTSLWLVFSSSNVLLTCYVHARLSIFIFLGLAEPTSFKFRKFQALFCKCLPTPFRVCHYTFVTEALFFLLQFR